MILFSSLFYFLTEEFSVRCRALNKKKILQRFQSLRILCNVLLENLGNQLLTVTAYQNPVVALIEIVYNCRLY